MAQSGWYDDPDGTPGRLRYWDGTQWSSDTMPKPGAAAPVPYGPSAAQAPSGSGYGTAPAYGPIAPAPAPVPARPARRRWLLPLVALVAGFALVGFVLQGILFAPAQAPVPTPATATRIPTPVAPRTPLPTSFPTVTQPQVTVQGGGTVAPAPTESGSSALPTMVDCPLPGDTTISDGTITVTFPKTWTADTRVPDWSTCGSSAGRQVTDQWSMGTYVGTIEAAGHTAQQTAEELWQWNLQNGYEGTGNVTPKVTAQKSVTVQGLPGYQIDGEIRVSGLPGVTGDTARVLVLQKPDGTQHAVLAIATLGDATGQAELDAALRSLKVTP